MPQQDLQRKNTTALQKPAKALAISIIREYPSPSPTSTNTMGNYVVAYGGCRIIPHSFGRNRPIVVNTEQILKKVCLGPLAACNI